MPRFCANLTYLFTEYPFLERFQAAAEAGFEAVEVLFPYDDPAPDIVRRLHGCGLPLALINTPPPNYTGGARGFAALPGGTDRFQRDFRRVLRYADRLRPQHIHILSGTAEGPEASATYVANLAWAAEQAPDQSLTIEPVNQADVPGYFLSSYDQAVEILAEISAPNLSLQFDAYHAQIITGDALAAWDRFGGQVRHVQVGGVPGRHEPVAGDIDYPAFFAALDAGGYDGWVSGEYNPAKRTEDGLGWMRGPA